MLCFVRTESIIKLLITQINLWVLAKNNMERMLCLDGIAVYC